MKSWSQVLPLNAATTSMPWLVWAVCCNRPFRHSVRSFAGTWAHAHSKIAARSVVPPGPVLQFPKAYVYGAMPVGAAAMILNTLALVAEGFGWIGPPPPVGGSDGGNALGNTE